ncbi:glycosyltransferase [Psychromonas sp. CNPT3]|uniref:glycosyltransferase family 4 protein n=1 Tax=Psychromonas sp. CNPT3 TaxID=314282 RepID=UPI0002C09FBA|nr:glycosyltransferase family 4 protein [Psychromonas sp. CNPT3]AGH82282.1 glycosyltransferase [Psychromonas sp. CNPT3]
MKITLFGSFPPPIGGISIHIKRVKLLLEKKGDEVLIYTNGNKEKEAKNIVIENFKHTIFKIPFLDTDILHFHLTSLKIRMLLGVYCLLGKKVILTIHGESLNEQLNTATFLQKHTLLWSLKKINKIVCVNHKMVIKLIKLGVKKENVVHIPASINPIESKNEIQNIPENVTKFMENASFLISANGAIRIHENEDLYGLDMLIELMASLKEKKRDVKLLFCVLSKEVQQSQEKILYQTLKNRILELSLENNIMLYEVENTEFYPILKKSDLFIRPTNTDGDAVSIREALFYGVPTITSNIVARPGGTLLFKSRDQNDLIEKVMFLLDSYQEEKLKVINIKVKDYFDELYCVYKEVSKSLNES